LAAVFLFVGDFFAGVFVVLLVDLLVDLFVTAAFVAFGFTVVLTVDAGGGGTAPDAGIAADGLAAEAIG
jgi:hypothetical protein